MTSSNPLVVIGGGLAGAAAVLTLAQAKLRPLWITPPASMADRPGEALAPAANSTLTTLGVADLLDNPRNGTPRHRRSNAMFSAWGSDQLVERNAIMQLEGTGWVLDRPAFEHDLVARAAAETDRVAASVEAVQPTQSGWCLELETGAVLEAGLVLDASGRRAIAARSLADRRQADKLVAAFAFLDQVDDSVEPSRATLIEAVEDGWWYAALLPGGRMALAWFTDPDLVPQGLSKSLDIWRARIAATQHISRWIADAGFDIADAPSLASAGTTWLEPCAAPGWAAAGDAAAAFDPLSSHGMTTALWSGRAAAEAMLATIQGQDGALEAYAQSVADGVAVFLEQRQRFYSAERRFAGKVFWERRR